MTKHKDGGGVTPGLGERLKIWRLHNKMRANRVCKIIKLNQSSYSWLENGKSLPSAVTLTNMIEYTDLNIIWLLTSQGEMINEQIKS